MSIQDSLLRLQRGNPDVQAALVIDSNGSVVSAGSSARAKEAAVAFAVPLRDLLERSVAELGAGALHAALIEGSAGTFAVADVDGDRIAVVVGQQASTPGALRADALWLAAQVRA
jgi:predicted regulator of Ras-like GTPase activity (Roadblock/LC7/MglB family)